MSSVQEGSQELLWKEQLETCLYLETVSVENLLTKK